MKGKTLFNLLALGLVLVLGALLIGLPALVDAQGPEPQVTPMPLGTAFTYQGRLADASGPVNGIYDFQFKLEDSASRQVGSPVTKNDVTVTDGLFTVQLDFGWSAFTGDARWLEIGVRPGSSTGAYTTLSPSQPLTAAPYALYSLEAPPASHDHLGWTWTGNNNPLVITGTFGGAAYAPLVLGNSNSWGDGLRVESAGRDGVSVGSAYFGVAVDSSGFGVYVDSADYDGVAVGSAGEDGVAVYSADRDGVRVRSAGNPSTTSSSTDPNGFEVEGAEGHGLYVGRADRDGVRVYSAGDDGVYVHQAGGDGVSVRLAGGPSTTNDSIEKNGFEVDGAEGHGLYVGRADADGVHVYSADDNGVFVGSAGGYAGYFGGDVKVTGKLSKGGGGFKIDHPLDPENQYLYHSFVESPDMMNVYNGNTTLDADGEAWVELPAWFEILNQDYRYQLTPIGAPGPNLYIAQEVRDNRFQIAGGTPGMRVSWQVTGIRHDPYAEANRIPVEEEKPPEERGTYFHPQAYGQPQTMGLAYKEAQAKGHERPAEER